MKKVVSLMLILSLLGFIFGCTEYQARGAGTGAVVGGVAGALISRSWRGGVIGAALGAVAGATIADISARANREAAENGQPVEYRTEDGRGVYRADPVNYSGRKRCHKVRERVWEDGTLVKDQVREICRSERYEPGY